MNKKKRVKSNGAPSAYYKDMNWLKQQIKSAVKEQLEANQKESEGRAEENPFPMNGWEQVPPPQRQKTEQERTPDGMVEEDLFASPWGPIDEHPGQTPKPSVEENPWKMEQQPSTQEQEIEEWPDAFDETANLRSASRSKPKKIKKQNLR
ncbi:hypothetical protein IC619_007660 [Hazenella sp. IB182353]|uniref:hypothetical protein n=1 Tax=Polycladospora coralii TaxID=2771432 RepID=UPI0017462FB4|nr:hypothetical protein [Polycladospora coralii]MBS7530366.1 hypothetical protein [Polycladospora coralii]